MRKISLLFSILGFGAFLTGQTPGISTQSLIPKRGVSSSVPAVRWDYGFLTGNGRIGAVVYGQPVEETIVFNHERLYLPAASSPTG